MACVCVCVCVCVCTCVCVYMREAGIGVCAKGESPWLVYVYVSLGCPCLWPVGVCLLPPPLLFHPGQLVSLPSEVHSLSGSSSGHLSSQRPCLILFIYKSWLAEEMRRSWEWGQSPGKGRGQVRSSHLKPSLASNCCTPSPPSPMPQPSPFLAIGVH